MDQHKSDEAAALPSLSLLTIAQGPVPLSKAQQQFNQLVQRIAQQRELLAQWQAFVQRYHQRLAAELHPAERELHAGQRALVLLIDELLSQTPASGSKGHSRAVRNKLTHLLLNLASQRLADGPDVALEVVFNRYSDVSLQELREQDMAAAQSVLSQVFGVDLGPDHGASTAEELMRQAARQMDERQARQAARQQERRAEREAKREAKKREQAAQKAEQSGSASAAEPAGAAPASAKAPQASQSIRAVYRKLASALHPDREPDPAQRERKTALMQRVNQAYDTGDLLTLLNLQLEIEQIDPDHLARVSPQQLAHYNQVLREQLQELDSELADCTEPFAKMLPPELSRRRPLTPQWVDEALGADIADLRQMVREIQQDLLDFKDPAKLRELMRSYQIEEPSGGLEQLLALGDLMADLEPAAPLRKRRRQAR
jgi:hypothetical protein